MVLLVGEKSFDDIFSLLDTYFDWGRGTHSQTDGQIYDTNTFL